MTIACLTVTAALVTLGQTADPIPPSMVKLEFEEKTVAEVVQAIDAAGPNRIAIDLQPLGGFVGRSIRGPARPADPRRFRFREAKPVPFWSAVDQICRAGQLMPVPQSKPARRIALRPASADRAIASIDGPFRASIFNVSYSRGIEFSPYFVKPPGQEEQRPNGPAFGERFAANVMVVPEPRLPLATLVELTVLEAVDDRGQSLILPDLARQPRENSPAQRDESAGDIFMPVLLRYPDEPGKLITRLKVIATFELRANGGANPTRTQARFEFVDVPMP